MLHQCAFNRNSTLIKSDTGYLCPRMDRQGIIIKITESEHHDLVLIHPDYKTCVSKTSGDLLMILFYLKSHKIVFSSLKTLQVNGHFLDFSVRTNKIGLLVGLCKKHYIHSLLCSIFF